MIQGDQSEVLTRLPGEPVVPKTPGTSTFTTSIWTTITGKPVVPTSPVHPNSPPVSKPRRHLRAAKRLILIEEVKL